MTLIELIDQQAQRLQAAQLAGQLSFGHGTTNAFDETVWLTLWRLNLPIDDLDAVADGKVSAADCASVEDLITERLASRKPAAYLTHEAWLQDVPFYVDDRVIVPRSFIAELLADGSIEDLLDATWLESTDATVLDLCTGNGSLAILAAMAYPRARITASDISADALAVARINVDKHQLDKHIALCQSDGLAQFASQRFDVILCNPPYVNAASMQALPLEYQAEPRLALASGSDGMDFCKELIAQAAQHLTLNGMLVLEIGNERAHFEAAFPRLEALWLPCSAGEDQVLALTRQALEQFQHPSP